MPRNLHTHTHNLLELINDFSKVTGYKINIPKSVVLLYGSKKHINTDT